MAKTRKPKDDENKLIQEKIQKQYESVFLKQDAPPPPMSIRQVEALQARVAELEAKLEKQSAAFESSTVLAGEIPTPQPKPTEPVSKDLASAKEPPPAVTTTNQIGSLATLTKAAEEIEEGDLSQEIKVTSGAVSGLQKNFAFNAMTIQLRSLIADLEKRVNERTHDLETASEVGRMITEKTTDLYSLLKEAVDLIRERFNLYYTQIYLTDADRNTLFLRAGTGEVGAELLRRRHYLPIGSGSLNGRAAADKRAEIVANTQKSANFLPNPLLPDTHSEMVIPLIASGQVVGVLDMQSEQPGALNETNLPAFKILAGQLAIAIQNAFLFAKSEQARSEVEARVRRQTEQGWQDFLDAIERGQKLGFAFDQTQVAPLKEEALKPLPAESALSMPIEVTGTKVGMIQVGNEPDHTWTSGETGILQAAAEQLAQHIENLRLLAKTEKYRAEAEDAVRRLTREGWDTYLRAHSKETAGFAYNLNEVYPLNDRGNGHHSEMIQPLTVRDEVIGELSISNIGGSQEDANELISAVATQLSTHIENLRLSEQNEKRAYELATVATVSTTASTVLDPDKLLQAVVDLTQKRFNIYHAHIYLADESWNTLLLAAGAGEIGRRMVADGWNIPIDHALSIVASAARNRQFVIANNITHDKQTGFLSNYLLPDTRSEMAIPMIVGEKLLGVFDVQADTANYFTEEDASIYTTLAAQVAVALQNARLYVEQAATVTQLRELDRLKSSFLANMSHELRTPLNSILGFADVMLEELDGPLTENMDNDLGLIQKNGQHLLHLINDVLDMAKIDSGRMNLNPEQFILHELLEEVVNITSPLAGEKSLPIIIEDDSDQTVKIIADRTRIQQVMINLVNNAIKFTEKGKITIHTLCQHEQVLIRVRDTGVGIPPEQLEAVFQEFTQLDTSTTRKTGGTGLGLPISRRLVEMHGGRLRAESTGVSGEGATFYVELPIEAKIAEPVEVLEK